MSWKQDVTPNLDPYVYNDGVMLTDWYGWCLATVRAAFNAPYSGPSAWSGWENYTQVKHQDRNWPVGVYFPIWFSGYGGLGHVAFAFINSSGAMRIWTSPYTHVPYFYTGYTSVDALAAGYGVTYVGWSEDIAGMRVIEQVADAPAPAPTKYTVTETYSPAKWVKLNKQPTNLWGMNYDAAYMVDHPVEVHNAGEVWEIVDKVHHEDGSDYYRRAGQVDGFNVVDCDDYTPPAPPQPSPTPERPDPEHTPPEADPPVPITNNAPVPSVIQPSLPKDNPLEPIPAPIEAPKPPATVPKQPSKISGVQIATAIAAAVVALLLWLIK